MKRLVSFVSYHIIVKQKRNLNSLLVLIFVLKVAPAFQVFRELSSCSAYLITHFSVISFIFVKGNKLIQDREVNRNENTDS